MCFAIYKSILPVIHFICTKTCEILKGLVNYVLITHAFFNSLPYIFFVFFQGKGKMTTYWLQGEKQAVASPQQSAPTANNISTPVTSTPNNCNHLGNNVANSKPKVNCKPTNEVNATTPLLQGDGSA